MLNINTIKLNNGFPNLNDYELYVFGYFEDIGLSDLGKEVNQKLNQTLLKINFKGKLNSSSTIYLDKYNTKIMLVGLGKSKH